MAKCPNCKKDVPKAKKTWNYGPFKVQAFSCQCGMDFRDYSKKGKHSFSLKLKKGKVMSRLNFRDTNSFP
jgi:hypothetical protein